MLHRGAHALYVDLGARVEPATDTPVPGVVGIVSASAAALPLALRLARPTLGALAGADARVAGGVLHLDDRPVRITRLLGARVPSLAAGLPVPEVPEGGARRLLDALPAVSAESVPRLVGSGPGLTPLGDDVLCGWLAWHRAAGTATAAVDDACRRSWSRTTTLSAALLADALEGEVVPEFADLVASLGTPAAASAAAALTRLGATSGAGMLYGVWSASLAHRAAAA